MHFGQNKLLFLIIFAGLAIALNADDQSSSGQPHFYPIRYKNCMIYPLTEMEAESQFDVLSVAITTDCSATDRCQFPRGADMAIQIVFKPNRRVESLQTAVWAHLGDSRGALTRFHVENENACVDSNITCPVEPGQTYWYTQPVRILNEYPLVDVQVNWLLTSPTESDSADQSDRGQPPRVREVCVKMLAKVMEHDGTD